MSASCTCEDLGQFADLNDFEYSRIDSDDLLLSFLEEPEFEAGDEELLRSAMESLDVEIAPGHVTNDSTLLSVTFWEGRNYLPETIPWPVGPDTRLEF